MQDFLGPHLATPTRVKWSCVKCVKFSWKFQVEGDALLPEILGQTDRVGAKSPIFNLFSPVAPQP